jgi:hypothetical protein
MQNIIPKNTKINPYYIVSPPYTHQSAGIKVLHLLCHYLNIKGYPAFICDYFSNRSSKSYINLDFITPLLTSDIVNDHKECNKNPIVVYPEIISGNPLNADCVVRYLLNYPGLIGGEKDEKYGNCDLIFSYSELIKESLVKFESEIMFMPVCDTNVFYEKSNRKIRRQGSCFYANKYQSHHSGKLFDVTNNSIEITRGLPTSQTPEQIAELFNNSEVFYSYEDTSLATEAILCGCPVIFLKNKFFTNNALASHELGSEGVGYNSTKSDIENAYAGIQTAQNRYFECVTNFWLQFENFIHKTQLWSIKYKGDNRIYLKRKRKPIGRLIKAKLKSLI